MCGINGYLGSEDKEHARSVVEQMNAATAHRGPNDEGIWQDDRAALGHQRLSILDLSRAGHQPMASDDGRYRIVYNGEIYNYKALKQRLGPYPYRSETDTEVILAAYKTWGKECVKEFNGMFAFAIWDRQDGSLFAARDRVGIKPFYYWLNGSELLFSSEIRALLQSGRVPKKVNRPALHDFLQYQTVHAPDTMIQHVRMLLPGHTFLYQNGSVEIEEYWNPADYLQNGDSTSPPDSYADAKQRVRKLLHESVERRLIADVPVGAFLSGGIDSSAIVGLMSEVTPGNVNTFSVTFQESGFDESHYARQVADRFGTDHTEIKLTPEDFLELLPDALRSMDHPSGDGPNTYVVSKVTREAGVTVALSGLGGDELFAGYPIFHQSLKLQDYRWISSIPHSVRSAAAAFLRMKGGSPSTVKIASLISRKSFEINHSYPLSRQVYAPSEISKILLSDGASLNPGRVKQVANQLAPMFESGSLISRISAAEIQTYMQNTLLRDTDQMSMASGLEVRVPFLDHLLVEELLSMGDAMKRPVTPKKLLTDSLGSLLPPEIVNRKKMGFDFPWEHWLKNELKSRVEKNMEALGQQECISAGEVDTIRQRFFAGKPGATWPKIWLLFVLQEWIQTNGIEL